MNKQKSVAQYNSVNPYSEDFNNVVESKKKLQTLVYNFLIDECFDCSNFALKRFAEKFDIDFNECKSIRIRFVENEIYLLIAESECRNLCGNSLAYVKGFFLDQNRIWRLNISLNTYLLPINQGRYIKALRVFSRCLNYSFTLASPPKAKRQRTEVTI